jgi:hypothetical protein
MHVYVYTKQIELYDYNKNIIDHPKLLGWSIFNNYINLLRIFIFSVKSVSIKL